MKTTLLGLWPFLFSYGLTLVMPGPNAILVIQASLYGSARSAILTVGGIASGAAILAALAAAGSSAVADDHVVRRVAHAVFISVLIVYGAKAIWRATRAEGGRLPSDSLPGARLFTLGLLTAVANPVTAAFFLSFAAGTGTGSMVGLPVVFPVVVFAVVVTWFLSLAMLLRAPPVRQCLARSWRAVECVSGLVLVCFGCLSVSRIFLS